MIVSNMKNRGKTGRICKPALCTWLLANISDSSEKHVKEQEHAAFDTAKADDAIVTLFNLLNHQLAQFLRTGRESQRADGRSPYARLL